MIRTNAERLLESRARVHLGVSLVVLLVASLLLARPAHADTFTVTNTSDGGQGSLR